MCAWNSNAQTLESGSSANTTARTRIRQGRRAILALRFTRTRTNIFGLLDAAGWDVHIADTEDKACDFIDNIKARVGLVYLDSSFNQGLLKCIENILSTSTTIKWIALLQKSSSQHDLIRSLISRYCHDYHTLPTNTEKLLNVLGHAWGMASMQQTHNKRHKEHLGDCGMIGTSDPMQRLYREITKAARSNAPVLLIGESGTGKELTAQAIHQLSRRHAGPYVAVNCAALPETLIHSELFGHEKGAFTGAHQRRIGHLETADGGTIFFDEIGDMPLDLQVNLLRFLEIKQIERLGSSRAIPVDVRIIAATHQDLEAQVHSSAFRQDLFYRLNVLHISIPSLRERGTDIELLAEHVLRQHAMETRGGIRGFSRKGLRALYQHNWPGNVRELINRVQRALVMSEHKLISPEDLGLEVTREQQPSATLKQCRLDASRKSIESALQRNCNNISQTARSLDVSRTTLYRLMEEFNISNA